MIREIRLRRLCDLLYENPSRPSPNDEIDLLLKAVSEKRRANRLTDMDDSTVGIVRLSAKAKTSDPVVICEAHDDRVSRLKHHGAVPFTACFRRSSNSRRSLSLGNRHLGRRLPIDDAMLGPDLR
jgi:hypothetical protein